MSKRSGKKSTAPATPLAPPPVPRMFKLYPEERHWWSFNDYGAVLDVMQRLQPKRVLEFGPGSSTLALIEGGATHIDALEDDPVWFSTYEERLQRQFPSVVHMHPYAVTADSLTTPATLAGRHWDLALVDGPLGTLHRPRVIDFCLSCCDAVLVPTEDLARKIGGPLRAAILELAAAHDRDVTVMETGPLSGAFALMTRR